MFLLLFNYRLLFSLDSIDSSLVYYFPSARIDTLKTDTLIDKIHHYALRNTLGSVGLPENKYTIEPENRFLGFQYSVDYFEKYYFDKDSIRFYNTYKPFTNVSLIIGQKKEQSFRMLHTQNIGRRLNFAVAVNRTRFDGWYLRQNVNNNNILFSSNYINIKNNYMIFVSAMYNNMQCAENGGLVNDSVFENVVVRDKKLIPVNLILAQKKTSKNILYARQNFYFGEKDSLRLKIKSFGLSHSISVENNKWVYQDKLPNVDYYDSFFEDSLTTLDSVKYFIFENTITLDILKHKKNGILRAIKGFGFITYQQVKLTSKGGFMDSLMNNVIIGGGVNNNTANKKIVFTIGADYVAAGANKNNYKGLFNICNNPSDSLYSLSFTANIDKRIPDFIYGKHYSNHFMWENNFNEVTSSYQNISASIKKWRLHFNATAFQFSNYLYFDNASLPRQYNDVLYAYTISLKKDFKFKNWFFSNNITYQHTADSVVLRFPGFVTKHSLYYANKLFKKALYVQVGVDAFYFSSYYANAYMPVLTQYYVQNQKKIGNYPFMDFFVNMKIKNAVIFLKMEHINSGLSGNDYYAAPYMPYSDRAFKVGINWRFDD